MTQPNESNARRARDFWVHVHGPRAADFEKVFGTARVAVQSPIPHAARLPGFDDPQPVYLLDLEWVAEQGHRRSLVDHISARFDIPAVEVERDLDQVGMPIREADTVTEIRNAQRWLT